jgi:anti-anti-sigma factor
MLFRVTADETSDTIRAEGEIDMAGADAFERDLRAMLTDGQRHQLDMSGVTFIDSAGLRALLRCGQDLNGTGPLVIVNPSRFVSSLMRIAGLGESEHIVISDARA